MSEDFHCSDFHSMALPLDSSPLPAASPCPAAIESPMGDPTAPGVALPSTTAIEPNISRATKEQEPPGMLASASASASGWESSSMGIWPSERSMTPVGESSIVERMGGSRESGGSVRPRPMSTPALNRTAEEVRQHGGAGARGAPCGGSGGVEGLGEERADGGGGPAARRGGCGGGRLKPNEALAEAGGVVRWGKKGGVGPHARENRGHLDLDLGS